MKTNRVEVPRTACAVKFILQTERIYSDTKKWTLYVKHQLKFRSFVKGGAEGGNRVWLQSLQIGFPHNKLDVFGGRVH